MNKVRPLQLALLCCLLALPLTPAFGAEPAADFLDALRRRGYFDMAIEYLNKAESSPLTPVEFREVVPYERGLTIVEIARREADFAVRGDLLNDAQAAVEQFVRTRGSHPRVDNAKNQLGNIVAERARMKIEQAEKTGDNKFRTEAGDLFDQAYTIFARRQTELKDRLAKMTGVFDPKRQKDQIALRNQLRADYLQAQLLSAAVLEESAETYKNDQKKYNETLQRAVDEYTVIYEKYRVRLAGLYAKLYRGRCLAKMGKDKDALADFEELLDNDDGVDALRPLKTAALLLALDVWLKPDQDKYLVAVQRGDAWVDQVRPNESRTAEWLTLRMQVARAHKRKADALKAENPKDPEINRSITEARKLATYVSRLPGDNQKAAREFLVELRGGDPLTADANVELPDSFLEAKARGKESLDSLQTAGLILRDVPKRIAAESNPEIKKELQTQVDQAKKTLATGKDTAYRMFKHALTLVDDETELADVNSVRYFICYLSFTRQNYYDSAVMGEFVARRYPEHAGARQCAKIALASYIQLHRGAPSNDREFETQQVIQIADYMANKWTDQPEGVDALNTLIPFMISRGDLDKAQQYLEMIPSESPQRAEAELSTGKAMWGKYRLGMIEIRRWQKEGAPEGVDVAARQAELDQLKAKAEGILTAGVSRMSKSAPTSTSSAAILSLAQVHLDKTEPLKAIELLERPQVGPFVLAKAGHPTTKSKGFVEETYRTALRAYIAALPKADPAKSSELIEKARGVMTLLKSEVAGDADGNRKLVGIYIALARDLENMIALAPPAEKVPLSKGFETFLDEVGKEATEFNVLNWVAETFYSLGNGLGGTGSQARAYYEKARGLYKKMIDSGVAQGKAVSQVRMRIAAVNRALGQYKDAMAILTEILTEQNMMLSVQIEAAHTYQEWADKLKDEKQQLTLYGRAMKGGELDKTKRKYIIWGWAKTARLTGGNSKYKDAFHEARYNFIKCRFLSGKATTNREKQKEFFQAAEGDVRNTVVLYADLGGPAWRARYDQLAKDIQRALGKTAVGLSAYEEKKTAAN